LLFTGLPTPSFSNHFEPLRTSGYSVLENKSGVKLSRSQIASITNLKENVVGVIAGLETWDRQTFTLFPNLRAVARLGVVLHNVDTD